MNTFYFSNTRQRPSDYNMRMDITIRSGEEERKFARITDGRAYNYLFLMSGCRVSVTQLELLYSTEKWLNNIENKLCTNFEFFRVLRIESDMQPMDLYRL